MEIADERIAGSIQDVLLLLLLLVVVVVVEILDNIRLPHVQAGNLGGLAVLVGTSLVLANHGDLVPVLVGVGVHAFPEVVTDVVVRNKRRLLQPQNNECIVVVVVVVVVVRIVIGNTVQEKRLRGDTATTTTNTERIDRFDPIVVPSQLVVLGGVEADAHVVPAVGRAHPSLLVAVRRLSIPRVGETEVVTDYR